MGIYKLPAIDLLEEVIPASRETGESVELITIQAAILATLEQFGMAASPGAITNGPTITRFELYPGPGVRMDDILALQRDLARATRAERIHILAPIPGKETVGIEIANQHKVPVTFRELLESDQWSSSQAEIPIALGKDLCGHAIISDLARLPHLLIAGTSGSGKSVCIHSILSSILYKFTPAQLGLVIIDPLVFEMPSCNVLPHLLAPVVTDPKDAPLTLRWVIDEMEKRYRIFAQTGTRNMTHFNARPEPGPGEETEHHPIPARMRYLVVIVNELADLMESAPAEIESAIARITRRGRAAGIHMIVATQTPRADIVTGVIKANIPSRIAFQVASKLDSRIILNEAGAERLLGQGDMLYLAQGGGQLLRLQGTLVTDQEISNLVEFASKQSEPALKSSHPKANACG